MVCCFPRRCFVCCVVIVVSLGLCCWLIVLFYLLLFVCAYFVVLIVSTVPMGWLVASSLDAIWVIVVNSVDLHVAFEWVCYCCLIW